MARPWQTPEQVDARLRKRWSHQRGVWLGGGGRWPQTFGLGGPRQSQAAAQWEQFGSWLRAWREYVGPGVVDYSARRWSTLGVQAVPARLRFEDPPAFAAACGESERWQRADARYRQLIARWPRLAERLRGHFDLLADCAETDFTRLCDVFAWLLEQPTSALFVRQVPVTGIHSKWIESRQQLLADWLVEVRGADTAGQSFHSISGLRREPERLRLRLLDPVLRAAVGGLGDIAAPWEEIAALRLAVSRVIVVENLQTGLAFGDLPAAVLFMARGYAVDRLSDIPWLHDLPLCYWGDIDTHGFAILHRLRSHLPQTHSLLMDEATLLAHASQWTSEGAPHNSDLLQALTAEERAVYDGLRQGRWGPRVRLEQERVGWEYAWTRVLARLTCG